MRRRLHLYRFIGLIVAFVGVATAWALYRATPSLHVGLPRYLGDLLPIYVVTKPTNLADPAAFARLLIAIATAVASVGSVWVAVARRWPTLVCLAITIAGVFATNVTVARVPRGDASFVEPFSRPELEYFQDINRVTDRPLWFIHAYPKLNIPMLPFLPRLSHHPGTHPPGGVLFLWLGSKVFGPSLEAACWWAVGFTALGVVPAYMLAQIVGGAASARRLLPLYVAAPNLILFGATCMDGVFLVFALAAMAAGFDAMRRWSFVRPVVAGALLWLATFMTFAVIAIPLLMGAYALCIGIRRPRRGAEMLARAALVGVAFIVCQLLAERFLGYDLRATVDAAMRRDAGALGPTKGYASIRFWADQSLANALAFLFGSGVAAVALLVVALAAVTKRRPVGRRHRAFAAAVPLALTLLATSTLFTLETERVWLFLTPALLIAAAPAFRGAWTWTTTLALLLAQAIWIEVTYKTFW